MTTWPATGTPGRGPRRLTESVPATTWGSPGRRSARAHRFRTIRTPTRAGRRPDGHGTLHRLGLQAVPPRADEAVPEGRPVLQPEVPDRPRGPAPRDARHPAVEDLGV